MSKLIRYITALVYFTLVLYAESLSLNSLQRYAVKGQFLCGNEPAKEVLVELVDEGKISTNRIF